MINTRFCNTCVSVGVFLFVCFAFSQPDLLENKTCVSGANKKEFLLASRWALLHNTGLLVELGCSKLNHRLPWWQLVSRLLHFPLCSSLEKWQEVVPVVGSWPCVCGDAAAAPGSWLWPGSTQAIVSHLGGEPTDGGSLCFLQTPPTVCLSKFIF